MSAVSTSARGASILIVFQLISRGFTFLVNQVLLRYLTPEILGLSAQLDLYARTVISFSRDSVEAASQRQAQDSQPVVNIAYLSVAFGAPLAYVLASIYSSTDVAKVAHFSSALWVYAASCILELLATPAYAVAQQRLLFRVRASAETSGTIFRCLITACTAILTSRAGFAAGVLPFAAGQLAFAIMFSAVYYYNISPISNSHHFSLFPRRTGKGSQLSGFLPTDLAKLSLSLFVQNSFKYVLTQGDGILVAALTSLADQGAYALASNYGGLVARMIFQPIEETTRSMFAQLCATPDASSSKKQEKDKQDSNVKEARTLLENVLRFYSIIGLVACTIGPTIAPTLLNIVAGRRWAETQAGSVLATYCYYIPLLAINGVTEGFVTAVAPISILHMQSAMMGLWFAVFGAAAWYFMRILELGARGLVLANCVNMLLRIIFNVWYFYGFFKARSCAFRWTAVAAHPVAIAASVGTWSIFNAGISDGLYNAVPAPKIVIDIGIAGLYGVILLLAEQEFLLQWLRPLLRARMKSGARNA